MSLDSYTFLWKPQRPQRTKEQIADSVADMSGVTVANSFSYEDRVATRSLLYVALEDANIRFLLDGFLLPPPFQHNLNIDEHKWSVEEVAAVVQVLDPKLDAIIVLIPFNLALRLGSYNARLRAACRRLCWILNVPFGYVEDQEDRLSQVRSLMAEGGGTDDTSAQQEEISTRKEERKRSLKRIATIGGFAIVGGAALLITGGLAAPLVAPAFAALTTAATASIAAIGAVGGAILGTGALAGAFAALVVGITTHATALAAIVTPVLTAANVTAVFGVSGATLAGFKAYRRTGDSDVFLVRSIDEVETFTKAAEDQNTEATLRTLNEVNQAIEKDQDGILGTNWDLSTVVEDGSMPGLVVPSHTRALTMSNVSSIPMVKKRNRQVVFGIDYHHSGYELRLKAIKLLMGVWGVAPPSAVPAGHTAVMASMNRYMYPTGAGFVVCYVAAPVNSPIGGTSYRVWVLISRGFMGEWTVSSFCEGIDTPLDPFKAQMRLEANSSESDYTKTYVGITMAIRLKPYATLKIYPCADSSDHDGRQVVFPCEELAQRQTEYMHDVKQRRKVGVSFVNKSPHMLYINGMSLSNGEQWPNTPSPMLVEPRTASLTVFTNTEWSLEGAEGCYICEIRNTNDKPVTANYFFRFHFEVTALYRLNVAVACAPTMREIRQMTVSPTAPESRSMEVTVKNGLFFSMKLRTNPDKSLIQLELGDMIERCANVHITQKVSLTIGVCGFSAIFDPRRLVQDQQVGLWQNILRTQTPLIGSSENYVAQWEDEYLTRFGETIKMDLQVADQISKKAVSKATKFAKTQIMQGAIFGGFRAFNALLGTFQLPLYAVWAAEVIDNNFATLSNRAEFAGRDLAKALLTTTKGTRPTSLIGFSFGCKVIAECLLELDRVKAYGIVDNVYLLGATIAADRDMWMQLRRVAAGRVVNVFTRSDWSLWLMFKVNEGDIKPMAGITPITVAGIENIDVTALVPQHSAYATKLGDILSYIPTVPTEETWTRLSSRGSPGVLMPI